MAGENDEWRIGPGRLGLHPPGEGRQIASEQRLLGNECGGRALPDGLDQGVEVLAYVRLQGRLGQQFSRRRCVAPDWSKYEDSIAGCVTHQIGRASCRE